MTYPLTKTLGRVMLVDDDFVDRIACERLLKRLGVVEELHCFSEAETALHNMEKGVGAEADVILLDVNMPRMNGLEFLDALRQSTKVQFSGAVAVMISTNLTTPFRAKFEQSPLVRTFLHKPLSPEELFASTLMISAER